MAGGLQLKTGRRTAEHVQSTDDRALNRGKFGKGQFRLSTGFENPFEIVPENLGGTFKPKFVRSGESLLWNGMHIYTRAPRLPLLPFPGGRQQQGLYIHYTQNNEGIEDASWEFSSFAPGLLDETGWFADNVTNIYALFATIDYDNTQIYSVDYKFPIIPNSEELGTLVQRQVTQAEREFRQQLAEAKGDAREIVSGIQADCTELENDLHSMLETADSEIAAVEGRVGSTSEVIWEGGVQPGGTITLNGGLKLSDFKSIGFFGHSGSDWRPYGFGGLTDNGTFQVSFFNGGGESSPGYGNSNYWIELFIETVEINASGGNQLTIQAASTAKFFSDGYLYQDIAQVAGALCGLNVIVGFGRIESTA